MIKQAYFSIIRVIQAKMLSTRTKSRFDDSELWEINSSIKGESDVAGCVDYS